jgi:hypothetical protein
VSKAGAHLFAAHCIKLTFLTFFIGSQLSFATAVVAEETEENGGTRCPPTFEEMMNKVLEIEGSEGDEDNHVFSPSKSRTSSAQHKAGGDDPMDAHAAAMEAAAAKADARLKMLREEKRHAEEEEALAFLAFFAFFPELRSPPALFSFFCFGVPKYGSSKKGALRHCSVGLVSAQVANAAV